MTLLTKKFALKIYLPLFLLLIVTFSCENPNKSKSESETTKQSFLRDGLWRMELKAGKTAIPFHFEVSKDGRQLTFINGEEKIKAEEVKEKGDSMFIKMPFFDSRFLLKKTSENKLRGHWKKGENYSMKATASFSPNRFDRDASTTGESKNIEGKWEVVFSEGTENEYNAIGVFKQEENNLSGTFITETGDYRFLDGVVSKDSLFLSTFDGSHAFLFKASLTGDSLKGVFHSGSHWKESWVAFKNEDAGLRHPDSLTYLKEGFDKIKFSFPDLDSQLVSLSDEKYKNKVVIVTIMGSWCPNCMDEASYLSGLYKKYNEKGLEIIALAFERSEDFNLAAKRVSEFKNKIGADYKFLIAGKSGKEEASKKLPMLNEIISYPTAIYIDRNGKIRKIHTGFYGPGTGKYFIEFAENTELFINKLLAENQ